MAAKPAPLDPNRAQMMQLTGMDTLMLPAKQPLGAVIGAGSFSMAGPLKLAPKRPCTPEVQSHDAENTARLFTNILHQHESKSRKEPASRFSVYNTQSEAVPAVDTLKPSTDSDSEYFAVKRRKLLVGTAAEAALTDASPAQPDASVIQRRASDELRPQEPEEEEHDDDAEAQNGVRGFLDNALSEFVKEEYAQVVAQRRPPPGFKSRAAFKQSVLQDNGLDKDFLEVLRNFMRDEHYTQRDLGRLLQCSQAKISTFLCGKMTRRAHEKMVEFMDTWIKSTDHTVRRNERMNKARAFAAAQRRKQEAKRRRSLSDDPLSEGEWSDNPDELLLMPIKRRKTLPGKLEENWHAYTPLRETVYEDRVLSSSLLSDKKRMKVKLFSPGEGVLVATPSTDGGSGAASPASECSSDQPGTSSKEGEEEVYDKPPAPPLSADQQQALCQLSEMERSMVEGLLAMSRSAPVYDSEQDDTEDVPPPAATSPPPPAAPAPAPAVKLSVPRRKVTMAGIPITRIPPSPLQQAVAPARAPRNSAPHPLPRTQGAHSTAHPQPTTAPQQRNSSSPAPKQVRRSSLSSSQHPATVCDDSASTPPETMPMHLPDSAVSMSPTESHPPHPTSTADTDSTADNGAKALRWHTYSSPAGSTSRVSSPASGTTGGKLVLTQPHKGPAPGAAAKLHAGDNAVVAKCTEQGLSA